MLSIAATSNPRTPTSRRAFSTVHWIALAAVMLCLSAAASLADASIAVWLRDWDLPGDLEKALNLSEAFAHGFGAAVILGTILLASPSNRQTVWTAVWITLVSGLTANALKATVVRIRPHVEGSIRVVAHSTPTFSSEAPAVSQGLAGPSSSETDGVQVVQASFWDARQRSFPSGHAATACGLAIGLSLLFPRAVPIFAMLALLACLQRLTSGAHFLSDVLAGAAVASACTAAIFWLRTIRLTAPPKLQPKN